MQWKYAHFSYWLISKALGKTKCSKVIHILFNNDMVSPKSELPVKPTYNSKLGIYHFRTFKILNAMIRHRKANHKFALSFFVARCSTVKKCVGFFLSLFFSRYFVVMFFISQPHNAACSFALWILQRPLSYSPWHWLISAIMKDPSGRVITIII